MKDYSTLIIDDFLNKKWLKRLRNSQKDYEKVHNQVRGWIPFDGRRINNFFEDLIVNLYPPLIFDYLDPAGYEYFIYEGFPDTNLIDWHVDLDEGLKNVKKGVEISEQTILLYFHPENVVGGELVVESQDHPIDCKINRLISFDGSIPHKVLEIKEGVRMSLVVNVWETKPFTFVKSDYFSLDDNPLEGDESNFVPNIVEPKKR